MELYNLLEQFKDIQNRIVLTGVSFLPTSIIKELISYGEKLRKFNLIEGELMVKAFLDNFEERSKIFFDLLIWTDIALMECENGAILKG